MKKTNLILLAIILISSILLVSCGGDAESSKTSEGELSSSVTEITSEVTEAESSEAEISEPQLEDMSEELVSLPFIPFD